jgi:RHS repeat-associated protein
MIALANWCGRYDSGVFPNGSTLTSGLDLKQVEWAGRNYRAFFDYVRDETAREPVWLGSLMTHKRDASGQLYMRNRYFDPTSGRFTQEDPIGIAGGLNLYGFGGGDPVSYSDPYGLCPQEVTGRPCTALHGIGTGAGAILGGVIGAGGGAVAGTVVLPVADTVGGGAAGAVAGAAQGGVLGLAAANVAELGAEIVGETGWGAWDSLKRVGRRGATVVALLGQLAGMGDTIPKPAGPGSQRPRVEQPGQRTIAAPRRDDRPDAAQPPRRSYCSRGVCPGSE